jgi:hypothetical protein
MGRRTHRQTLHLSSVKKRNVRFGSKADIAAGPRDVRFTPESGQTHTPQLSAKIKRPAKTRQPIVSAASHVRTGKGVKSCSSTAATTITTT